MAKNQTEARRHGNVAFFKRGELDYVLQLTLGTVASDAAAVGEVFHAASRIDEKDKNMRSWIREWKALGERVETKGRTSLERGHRVSAREALLRAYNYLRTSTYAMRVDEAQLRKTFHHARACFRTAAKLFDPPLESFEIDCEGVKLSAYFARPDADSEPRPTLIGAGGGENFCEDIFIYFGAAALKRGYNLLVFDLPGQGTNALEGNTYRHDVEVPMAAAIDWLIQRPEVDPRRIIASGVSLGGYTVMRSAAHEPRLAAISGSTPIVDFQELIRENGSYLAKLPSWAGAAAFKLLGKIDPFALIVYEKFTRAAGAESPADAFTVFQDWIVDPSQITCPVLCLVGVGEHDSFRKQARKAYDGVAGPKTMHEFTLEDGADGHCQANNFALASQVTFDWFDEVLTDR
jgi:pimeloyl-ACP methyl ester carboxylesterase